jgi:hypothetical protein
MSEATSTNTPGGGFPPFKLELVDLDAHPDGVLLRLIAEGTKAQEAYDLLTQRRYRKCMARADRAELSAAATAAFQLETKIVAIPARTSFGLLAKAMFALGHPRTRDRNGANLTWGLGGLLFSVVEDSVRMGAFS